MARRLLMINEGRTYEDVETALNGARPDILNANPRTPISWCGDLLCTQLYNPGSGSSSPGDAIIFLLHFLHEDLAHRHRYHKGAQRGVEIYVILHENVIDT